MEFDQIDDVQWTEESLIITGIAKDSDGSGIPQTDAFSLEDVSAILVRSLDPNRTSGLVAGVFLVPIAIWMVLVSGQSRAGCDIGTVCG